MSIRMLAVELYRVMRQIEELKKSVKNLPPESPERQTLEEQLRKAGAEEYHLRKLMEGAKD